MFSSESKQTNLVFLCEGIVLLFGPIWPPLWAPEATFSSATAKSDRFSFANSRMAGKVIGALRRRWKNYRFRFVPWVAFNMHRRLRESARIVPSPHLDPLVSACDILSQLEKVLPFFTISFRGANFQKISHKNNLVMRTKMGFVIDRGPSLLPGGGTGVFVTRGLARKGQLVALYPGTIYRPFEPILLPSLNNPFIFRCLDGVHIDGKDWGLSKVIFKSCAGRDKTGPGEVADGTWLTKWPSNPLNVGQYVNNHTREASSNVAYQELDLPSDFDKSSFYHQMRPLLPYINYGGSWGLPRRMVALVATRDIPKGQELLSSYLTLVGSK